MKILLTLIICSQVAETCLNPYTWPETFNTQYDCLMFGYEEAQMYQLAKRWTPSEDTNTANHILLSKYSKAEWREILIKENTPDYEHKYWR